MPLQEYNTANENSLGGYLPAGTPDTWQGQTWLALSSYSLTSIRLKLWRGYASYEVEYGTLYCDIFEATDLWLDDTYNIIAPDTLLGTSAAIDVVTALPMDPAEYTWYEIVFSTPVTIVQGSYYGMSLRRPEANTARDVYWRGNSVAQYADGIRCWSYDAGDTWVSSAQHYDTNASDWVFEIYGEAVDDDMAGTSVCASSSTGTLELVTPLQGVTVGSSQSTGALIAIKSISGTLRDYNSSDTGSGMQLDPDSPDYWVAQTWLATSSYVIDSLRLKMWRGTNATGTIYCDIFPADALWQTIHHIVSGSSLGNVAVIDAATLEVWPDPYPWVEWACNDAISIVEGNYYGIVLHSPNLTKSYIRCRANAPYAYANGIPCWSSDGGSTWASYTSDVGYFDTVFEIYGSDAADDDMAGTSICVSSSAGTLELVTPLQGTTVGSSQSTGALIAIKSLSGTCTISTSASGTFGTIIALSGTCTVVATTSGTCINTKVLNGQIDALANSLAALSLSLILFGQSNGVSSSDGLLTNAKLLTAITSILSDSSGILVDVKVFNGQIAAISDTSGILNKLSALTGQVNTLSSAGGILNSVKGLSGTVLVTSQIPPVLLCVTKLLTGQSSATAISIGSIDVFKTLEAISTIISGSEVDLWRRLGLKGRSDSLSTSLGTLILSCGLAGQSTCISSSSGYLQSLLQLFGLSASQSSSTGLLLANLINLAGQIDALSSSSGDAIRIPGLFGLIHATSFSTSHLRTVVRGKSSLNAISQLSGYLTGQLALSGQTDVLSGSEAFIERLATEFLVHSFSIIPILETSRLRLNEEILLR